MGLMDFKFGADTGPLDKAKSKLEDLKKSAEDFRADRDGGLFGESMSEANDMIRQISENITRMKSLVLSGEHKGGILNTRQWAELGKISDDIADNIGRWEDEITKARTALFKLGQEKRALESVGLGDPEKWSSAQERLGGVREEEKALQKHYDKLHEKDLRVQHMSNKAEDLSTRAGTLGQEEEGGGFGWKKLLGGTLALAGGFSIMSYLNQSRNEYRSYQQSLGGLAARGIYGVNPMLGFGAKESVDIMRGITHSTGYSGRSATGLYRSVAEFARANDVDPGQASSLMGGYRDMTGDKERSRRSLYLLTHIAENTKETPDRINRTLNSGFSILSAAQGGKELSATQQGELASFAQNIAQKWGTLGKNPSTMQALGGAFGGTGNKFIDMMIAEATGLIGGGAITEQSVARAREMKGAGLLSKEGRGIWTEILKNSKLSKTMKGVVVGSMLGITNQKASEDLVASMESGEWLGKDDAKFVKYLNGIKGTGVEGATQRKSGAYMSTAGARIAEQEYHREANRLKVGEGLFKVMAPIEDLIIRNAEKALKSGKLNSALEATVKASKWIGGLDSEEAKDKYGAVGVDRAGTSWITAALVMLGAIKLSLDKIADNFTGYSE